MKAARRASAVIIGFVFFLAGILKLMDPVGAGLVVEEYFKFFHLRFLTFSSEGVGVIAALAETLTGAALITGVWRRIVGIVAGVMLAFFTLLTLVLLIANPVMDCGCFGEAVHLTHLQSFLKNVALCALWALAFIPLSAQEEPRKTKYAAFGVAALSVMVFMIMSLAGIPLMDFTPYAPGEELQSDGTVLSFSDSEGQYCDSLAVDSQVALVTVYDCREMTAASWKKVSASMDDASEAGFNPLLLVASTPSAFASQAPQDLSSRAYFADRKDLLTFNRSNGGMTAVCDGQIVAKWPLSGHRDLSDLVINDSADATELMMKKESSRKMKFQGFLLYVFAVMLLI